MSLEHPHHGRILVVDDEPPNVALLIRLLNREGYDVDPVFDGESALQSIARRPPDVVLLDVHLPGLDGFEVCRRIKSNPATRLIPVVLLTALDAREQRIAGFNAGADEFLGKPFDAEELRARMRSLVRLKRYTDELDSAETVILSLALTVEARDSYTQGHCERLSEYAQAIGRHLGMSNEEVRALRLGGYLHDVGKIAVPDAVLQKPARLTPAEFSEMQQHTVVGERLCGNLRSLAMVRPIVRSHHERLDGSGYPDALKAGQVPLLAQIVGVVDVYDALTTTRPYRLPVPDDEAFAEVRQEAARGLHNPLLVDALVAIRPHEIRIRPRVDPFAGNAGPGVGET
jgi:putative two-component system response regulator